MARKYGVQSAKAQASPPSLRSQGTLGGRVHSLRDIYTLTADLAAADIIEIGELPIGARVIDCRAVFTDLDASGGTVDVGWEASADAVEGADADGFMAAMDVTSAGSISMFEDQSSRPGYQKVFAAPVKVVATILGDTDATTGTVDIEVLYVID